MIARMSDAIDMAETYRVVRPTAWGYRVSVSHKAQPDWVAWSPRAAAGPTMLPEDCPEPRAVRQRIPPVDIPGLIRLYVNHLDKPGC